MVAMRLWQNKLLHSEKRTHTTPFAVRAGDIPSRGMLYDWYSLMMSIDSTSANGHHREKYTPSPNRGGMVIFPATAVKSFRAAM